MSKAPSLIGIAEPLVLTIDNGGTRTRLGRGGEVVTGLVSYETPVDYSQAIKRIASTATTVLAGKKPDAVGFSVAGKVEAGRIVSAGKLEENGWCGNPFASDVAAELGIEAENILLLNDCAAGATAERAYFGSRDGETSAFMVLSTGFGAALYTAERIIPDEPGHEYLKGGATCPCGKQGHVEAHIGGAGIKAKYGIPGEDIPHTHPFWTEIKGDFNAAMGMTLDRYNSDLGISLHTVGFTGSVALGGPGMLQELQLHLIQERGHGAPMIQTAQYKDESGLYGASFAATAMVAA